MKKTLPSTFPFLKKCLFFKYFYMDFCEKICKKFYIIKFIIEYYN